MPKVRTFTIERDIKAAPPRVATLALSVEQTPAVFPVITRIEVLDRRVDPQGLAVAGMRWREHRQVGRHKGSAVLTITQRDGERSFTVSSAMWGMAFDCRFELSPVAVGTLVTLTTTMTATGLLARLLINLAERPIREQLSLDLDALKAAAEAA